MKASNNLRVNLLLHGEGLAPNSYHATMQALGFIEELSRFSKIADIGCGTGLQTIILSKATKAKIIAVDSNTEFIEHIRSEINVHQLNNRIYPVIATPDNLPFYKEELDMIWCESVIGNIGLPYALLQWEKYIRKGGYISLCSYCWLTEYHPESVSKFWDKNNNEIDTIDNRLMQLRATGFIPMAYFVMPDECWWNYFCPLIDNFDRLRIKYPGNYDVENLIRNIDEEITLYEKYGEHYGYVFFVGKKINN